MAYIHNLEWKISSKYVINNPMNLGKAKEVFE